MMLQIDPMQLLYIMGRANLGILQGMTIQGSEWRILSCHPHLCSVYMIPEECVQELERR